MLPPVEWEGVIRLFLAKEQYSPIKTKVFEKDLLEGTLMTNMQKTFVMPIYKELSNLHLLPQWKHLLGGSSNLSSGAGNSMLNPSLRQRLGNALEQQPSKLNQLAEPSEYMRRIGEHFISFIHKLD